MTTSFQSLSQVVLVGCLVLASCGGTEEGTTEVTVAEITESAPDSTNELPPISDSLISAQDMVSADTAETQPSDALVPPTSCSGVYGEPTAVYTLPGQELLEISGLVSSRQSPGLLWAHNDSGAAAELLAFSEAGLQTRLSLSGVQAIDWEDLARASCPQSHGDCLWVADMGNNLKNREILSVIVVQEPPSGGAPEQTRVPEAVYTFSYPEDTMDAEALLVSPEGDRFYVLEKTDGDTARVFSSPTPLTTGSPMTLVELTTMQSPGEPIPYGKMITGADLHWTGTRVAVRCYTGTWEFRFAANQGLEHLGEITPTYVALGPLEEVQGETVAYSAAGLDLFTASEDPNELGDQPVHRYVCLD